MRAAGVCAVDAAVDTMVLIYSLAFPADWKFLASGSDVKVVRAYRLQFLLVVSPQWGSPRMQSSSILAGCDVGLRDLGCELPESVPWTLP